MQRIDRDGIATALIAVLTAVYAAYIVRDGLPLVRDVEEVAGVGLVLGFASRRIGGRKGIEHEGRAFAAGLACLALGIAALATASEIVLALFIAANVGLWAAAALVRTGHRVGGVRLSH